jgi:hypothetical protein
MRRSGGRRGNRKCGPCRNAVGDQDVDFEPEVLQQGSKFGVREFVAAGPIADLPNAG